MNLKFATWETWKAEAGSHLPLSVRDFVTHFGYGSDPNPENNYTMLEHCADIFDLDFPFEVRTISKIGQLVVDRADDATIGWLARLGDEVNGDRYGEVTRTANRIDCREESLRRAIDASDRLEFLDEGRQYFWKRPSLPPQNYRITRNRILTSLCKVFSVTDRAETHDLACSIPRTFRERTTNPEGQSLDVPIPVLEGIAERSGLFEITDGEIRRRPDIEWCSIGRRDLALLEICVAHGRVVPSNVIYSGLVRDGLTSENAGIVVAYSPFLVHAQSGVGYKQGIYKFVPQPEEIDLDTLRARISADNGANDDDDADAMSDVCLRIPISSRTRLTGRYVVTESVDFDGTWEVRNLAGLNIGRVTVSERVVSGLKSIIAELKLENDDLLELRADGGGALVAENG